MSKITMVDYYKSTDFRPSEKSLSDHNIDSEMEIRHNLYHNLLKIPVSLFGGTNILEVGCSAGDSALITAMFGAKLTLLDFDENLRGEISRLFSDFGMLDSIEEISMCGIEKYDCEKKFDIITAEGFLATLPDRKIMLSKMAGLLKDNGLIVFTFSETYGSFFEFVKKVTLIKVYRDKGIEDITSDKALLIAKELFSNAFSSLSSSRKFEVWWRDMMISPFLSWENCWNYEDIINSMDDSLSYYSSTPLIYEGNIFSWYKNIVSNSDLNKRAVQSYRGRRLDLVFGGARGASSNNNDSDLVNCIEALLKEWSVYFDNDNLDFPRMNFNNIYKLFNRSGFGDVLSNEIYIWSKLMSEEEGDTIVDYYKSTEKLSTMWGSSHNYLVLSKNT